MERLADPTIGNTKIGSHDGVEAKTTKKLEDSTKETVNMTTFCNDREARCQRIGGRAVSGGYHRTCSVPPSFAVENIDALLNQHACTSRIHETCMSECLIAAI